MTARKLPSSSNARSLALVLRESLRELGYTCEYRIGQRHFSRFTFVITLDRFARTFRFKVSHPARFDIECWDESPGHGGQLHFLEVSRFDGGSRREVTRLLRLLAVSLPRLPWKFPPVGRGLPAARVPEGPEGLGRDGGDARRPEGVGPRGDDDG